MVNYGVSRACETCKQRRKKGIYSTFNRMNYTNESCNRCVKASRVCLGYKDDSNLLFRHWDGAKNTDSSTPALAEPSRATPQNQRALDSFFDDYCVESIDRSISRGFLDGLQSLINNAGQSSDIAQAARIVALAGIGNRTNRPDIVHQTKLIYGDLLRSFQTTLLDAVSSNTTESLMTAVLLGLYEIITSTEGNPDQHVAHVRGVSAILCSENSPFDLLAGTDLFQLGNPLLLKAPLEQPHTPGVLCAPTLNGSIQSLDAILIRFNPVFHRANALLPDKSTALDDIQNLKQNAIVLDQEFSSWSAGQTAEWQPRSIGTIRGDQTRSWQSANFWPGNIDTYFDLYVAAVWNTYRKTHLMILDIIVRCLKRLEGNEIRTREQEEVQRLAEGIAASVPYHLTEDLQGYIQGIQAGSDTMIPGKPVGGLLLLHPLYVVARSSVVSPQLQAYMSECLEWIGKNMGIGQATLLSNASILNLSAAFLPFQYIAEGHVLIWAGMLIQPF
ncbi:hypothetical protein AOQ84DRAFT_303720 [Glonium stellatum]|uniref:Zn(2)-C6 fungal-type domain-containing protein n=1 Tax=Glonium stellatum TaxID=574774 RepID=A0A8E2EQW3_9PEZI|nr:hypothetical protein AOQ84DRAFT_303720 [Glonium stellatum]